MGDDEEPVRVSERCQTVGVALFSVGRAAVILPEQERARRSCQHDPENKIQQCQSRGGLPVDDTAKGSL